MTVSSSNLARKLGKGLRVLADRRFRRGLLYGVAAAIEHVPVLAGRRCNTVVDIGANRGQFTLLTEGLYPGVHIYAFEPLSGAFRTLSRVSRRNRRIAVFNHAIGPHSGLADFYLSHSDDSSSLLPITPLQEMLFPDTGLSRIDQVQVARLDSILRPGDLHPPCLLKIDVQGYELQVLNSCGALLSAFDLVYVECSFLSLYEGQALAVDVVAYMNEQGARLEGIYNVCRDRNDRAVQADFLFSRGDGDVHGTSTGFEAVRS